MALDPQLLPYVDVAPRVGRGPGENEPGIGLGAPQHFAFTAGMSWTGPVWQLDSTDVLAEWAVRANDGYMRFTIPARVRAGSITASIRAPFANTEGSVSIGFRLRVGTLQGGPLQLFLAGGVILRLGTDGSADYVVGDPHQPPVGTSSIRVDGSWHDVLLSVTPSSVAVWEGDEQRFVAPFAAGPVISVLFSAAVQTTQGTTVTFDVSDVVVVSGTDKQVRPSRGLLDSVAPALAQAQAMVNAVQPQLAGLQQALTPVAQVLNNTHISWRDWLWGRDVDPAMQLAVDALVADPRARAFVNAAEAYRSAHASDLSPTLTLCLSVGISITAVVSVGSAVGLNIDFGNGRAQLIVSASGGAATNVSIGFGLEVLFFGRGLSEALGWFFYTKGSGGEVVTFAVGVAGGIPAEQPRPGVAGNVGLALGIGIGAGLVPVDVGGGVSYSWPLS